MALKNKILITGFFLIITISCFLIFWMKYKEDTFADEIITNTSTSFKVNFNDFLTSVEESTASLNDNFKHQDSEQLNNENLNIFFSKMILDDHYLIGVLLTNPSFSYVIYRENSTWAVSYDLNVNDSLVNWKRLNNKLEVVSEWTDAYNFFLNDQKLNDINNQLKSSKFLWKTIKSNSQENWDLLSNIFQTANVNGEEILAGLVFSSKEIKNRFNNVLKFKNPLVSLLTINNDIVTPIITSDTIAIATNKKLEDIVAGLISKQKDRHNLVSQSYSFELLNKIYWTRVEEIKPTVGVEGFSLTMSEAELVEAERKQELIYLYISLFFLAITIILVIILFRKKKTSKPVSRTDELPSLSNNEILDLIQNGEAEYIEFKSSLRWDYHEEKVNKVLENVILKSLAAFANAKGGTLFIGVNDDMEILGLEKDFNTLRKPDADYFELHLRKLINNQYGIAFSNENLLMTFPHITEKIICSIQVKAAGNPVFLKIRNKDGNEVEKFYVRSGNASQEISSLKEINDYINIRFDS